MRTNLGRWERIGSVAAGAGLLYLAGRQARFRRGSQMVGAGLVARGVTGVCAVKHALVGDPEAASDTKRQLGGDAGIHVRESVIIGRPVEEVYAFWRDFDNLSRFLSHVERVEELDERRSHWVVRGPGNLRFEWDAEIISDDRDELLSWKSIGTPDVVSAGSVIFRSIGSEQTQVAVHFQYAPPGGRVGRGIAALLGQDPNTQVRDDLQKLKHLLEQRQDAAVGMPASTDAAHQPW